MDRTYSPIYAGASFPYLSGSLMIAEPTIASLSKFSLFYASEKFARSVDNAKTRYYN